MRQFEQYRTAVLEAIARDQEPYDWPWLCPTIKLPAIIIAPWQIATIKLMKERVNEYRGTHSNVQAPG